MKKGLIISIIIIIIAILLVIFFSPIRIAVYGNKTEYIKISKDQKEEREYKIKITYDKNNTVEVGDILEQIQVKVHTEQEKA